jgi:hypothetical protein
VGTPGAVGEVDKVKDRKEKGGFLVLLDGLCEFLSNTGDIGLAT